VIGALLGPQQLKQTLGAAVAAVARPGPVAIITAGWQEREDQDEEFTALVGRPTVNLKIYERTEALLAADPELATAHRARQDTLRQIQEFYRLRLVHAIDAALDISRKSAGSSLEQEELHWSVSQLRRLDEEHLQRCRSLRKHFEVEFKPLERPGIVKQREELLRMLKLVDTVVIAGGHVAALLNRMRLLGVETLIRDHALLAVSGGAMVTSERVVLFHESPPEGEGISEVLEEGLGLHKGVLPLPNPKLRLKLDDPVRVGWLARRYAPAKCIALDQGDWVRFEGDTWRKAEGTQQLREDGTVLGAWVT
jgi:hypothetical protein